MSNYYRAWTIALTLTGLFFTAADVAQVNAGILLPAATGPTDKIDAGVFAGGTQLQIVVTGTVDMGGEVLVTNPDGSLAFPLVDPTNTFTYFNPGATNYPTTFGGDGVNHYAGGGSNFDILSLPLPFGPAGAMTTDSTDPAGIRFGAVIGTFSAAPSRSDWFLIGYGTTVIVPGPSSHLYLAVNDTAYGNNIGSYDVTVTSAVPEPASLTLFGFGALGLVFGRKRRRRA